MIKKGLIIIFLFAFLAASSFAGEINSVIYEQGALKIQLSDKSEYKLIPQNDPFKINILLNNANPGILSKKMLFHEGIVSEIYAKPHDKESSILEITLAEPSKPSIDFKNNTLILNFESAASEQKLTKYSRIIDLLVKKIDDGYEISIYGDTKLPEPHVVKEDNYIRLFLDNTNFNADLPADFPIDLKKDGDGVMLGFLVGKDFDSKLFHLDDEIVIEISKIKKSEIKINTNSKEEKAKKDSQDSTQEEITKISVDFQDADVVGVLRLIGEKSGYNMVIHPEVKGKITLKLTNVPWTQALDVVCKTFYFEKVIEGNIIRVAPVKVFQEEKKLQAETKDLFKKAEDTDTKIITLKYASPEKVKATVEGAKLLSPQGNIVIDDRTRAVIVKDIPSALKNIENFIVSLDKPIRQILLETRILEISSNFSKSLGFEWGISWFPHSTSTITGSQSFPLTVPGGSTPLAINLPASSGATGIGTTAFTIGYLNPAGTFALDLRISALQESGKGKIVSNPKIITLDNQKAKIVQGESIPYGEKDVQRGEISTKFKDVAIIVETTPHLIDDRSLQLDIHVIKEDLVEFINIGGTFAPRTTKLEGLTRVKLRDGETLVIGGIYKKKETIRDSKVPFLGDIPVAGELFKSTGRDETLYEVMIFITPRVLSYE